MSTPTRHFLVKSNKLSTLKMFVEFHQPESLVLLSKLRDGAYHARPLTEVKLRIFDGPFGSDRKIDMYQSSGIPYMRVKDVLPDGIDQRELMYISEEKHAAFSRSKVVPGNVLMTIAGRVGTAAVFPEELVEGNITGHIVGIELPDTVNPHYLAAFINSELGQFQVARWAHRTTRPELNLFEVGQILIPVPPRPVQDCIAEMMQDAYSARRQMLEESKKSLRGVELQVCEVLGITDIPPFDEKQFIIKRSVLHRADVRFFLPFYSAIEDLIRLGKYETFPLKNLCMKITSGLTPARSVYTESGCVVIKVASLTKDWRVDWERISFTSEEFFSKAEKAYVQDGDILVLSASHQLDYIGRSFGIVREIPDSYIGSIMAVGELINIRANSRLMLPDFLLACLTVKHFQELINRMTRGQSAHLYAEDLQYLRIPKPPISVQQQIVDEVSRRRAEARRLRNEADNVVAEAKARVERMILGEETV